LILETGKRLPFIEKLSVWARNVSQSSAQTTIRPKPEWTYSSGPWRSQHNCEEIYLLQLYDL